MYPCHFYAGLDVGQARDYSAFTLVEEALWIGKDQVAWEDYGVSITPEVQARADGWNGWILPSWVPPKYANNIMAVNYQYGRPPNPPLFIRELRRFELGTKYTTIVAEVKKVLDQDPISRMRWQLLVDATGVGRAVSDLFGQKGVRPINITITGGDTVSRDTDKGGWRVPKRDLIVPAQVLLQNELLKIIGDLELVDVFIKELLNFRIKLKKDTGHDTYEHWREDDHDDLVLAVSMMCWYQQTANAPLEQRNEKQGGFRWQPSQKISNEELKKGP